jgi:hypothetical protein
MYKAGVTIVMSENMICITRINTCISLIGKKQLIGRKILYILFTHLREMGKSKMHVMWLVSRSYNLP